MKYAASMVVFYCGENGKPHQTTFRYISCCAPDAQGITHVVLVSGFVGPANTWQIKHIRCIFGPPTKSQPLILPMTADQEILLCKPCRFLTSEVVLAVVVVHVLYLNNLNITRPQGASLNITETPPQRLESLGFITNNHRDRGISWLCTPWE